MNKTITFRVDEETLQNLDLIKEKLKISKADIVRMAISYFKNYVERVNK